MIRFIFIFLFVPIFSSAQVNILYYPKDIIYISYSHQLHLAKDFFTTQNTDKLKDGKYELRLEVRPRRKIKEFAICKDKLCNNEIDH